MSVLSCSLRKMGNPPALNVLSRDSIPLILERMRSFLIHRSLTTLKMKPVDRSAVPSIRVIDLDRGRGHVHTYACTYVRHVACVVRTVMNYVGETNRQVNEKRIQIALGSGADERFASTSPLRLRIFLKVHKSAFCVNSIFVFARLQFSHGCGNPSSKLQKNNQ